jgi:hypothetical protein
MKSDAWMRKYCSLVLIDDRGFRLPRAAPLANINEAPIWLQSAYITFACQKIPTTPSPADEIGALMRGFVG